MPNAQYNVKSMGWLYFGTYSLQSAAKPSCTDYGFVEVKLDEGFIQACTEGMELSMLRAQLFRISSL